MAKHKGACLHSEIVGYGTMSGLLRKMAAKMPPEPRKEKPEPKRKGKIKIPDEVVIAIRTAFEHERLPLSSVCARFPDVKPDTVRKIVDYQIRANLLPQKPKTKHQTKETT